MFTKSKLGKSLKNYTSSGVYPFHMPGHKRNPDFLPEELAAYDITELPGFDNLMNPSGILLSLERRFSGLFESRHSFLLVNGSTAGVLAAILHTVRSGKIIMARNCHRSAYSAVTIAGLEPVYVLPETTDIIIGGITPAAVEEAFSSYDSRAKAVVITSPTYEGVVSDIRGIAEVTHRHGALLIVDEAHGAHMRFHKYFPESALSLGADIVIQSLHKTLPAMNQLGIVHISGKIDPAAFRRTLSMLQTSSPSYLLMAQAEDMLERLSEELFDDYVERLSDIRAKINKIPGISLIEHGNKCGGFDVDISKITIVPSALTGTEIYGKLREDYGLQLEYATDAFALAYSTVADTSEGFNKLYKALSDISAKTPERNGGKIRKEAKTPELIVPKRLFSARDTLQMPYKRVKIDDAKDCVSASYVIPYPPGIPLLVPGEEISAAVIAAVSERMQNGAEVIGVYGGGVDVIENQNIS